MPQHILGGFVSKALVDQLLVDGHKVPLLWFCALPPLWGQVAIWPIGVLGYKVAMQRAASLTLQTKEMSPQMGKMI